MTADIYELVLSTDPKSKLAVLDIDESTSVQDLEVVFGVGILGKLGRQGYVGLKRADLLVDVLLPTSSYDARRMVDEALPAILRQPGQIPIFRYLRQAGRLRDDGSIASTADLDSRLATRAIDGTQRFAPAAQSRPRSERLAASANYSIDTLISTAPITDVLLGILSIPLDQLDLEALRGYLLSTRDAFETVNSTAWAKAVCLYDYHQFASLPKKSDAEETSD